MYVVYASGQFGILHMFCTQNIFNVFFKGLNIGHASQFKSSQLTTATNMSRLVGKPTMWFPNRSDTNRPVQAQKRARSLKFRI